MIERKNVKPGIGGLLISVWIGCAAVVNTASAQHEHEHDRAQDTTHVERGDALRHGTESDQHASHMEEMEGIEMGMSSAVLPDLPMSRDGSGTSWHPDASPVFGSHVQAGEWELMFHGNLVVRYNAQDAFDNGTRGDQAFGAPNWLMAMAQRDLNLNNQVGVRTMISLDPITEGGNGYPLLFQTGETFEEEPLIDRQHPHELFSELAVMYGRSIGERAGFFAYLGFPGAPALGPPVFMHRPSALHLPDSPLGHHWQDATHILFGVATIGFRYDVFKLDGSVFTGREPDENRFDFDRPRFDSYSLRLAANPNDRWALQVSRGFLKEPEVLHPEQNQWRTSASALHVEPLSGGRVWANSLVWGMNQIADGGHHTDEEPPGALHSLTFDSDVQLRRQAFYGRAEWVEKPAGELGLDQFGHSRMFGIGALSLGTARDLVTLGIGRLELGGHATFYRVPEDLRPVYGSQPVSLQIYIRLSSTPVQMRHAEMPMGDDHEMPMGDGHEMPMRDGYEMHNHEMPGI